MKDSIPERTSLKRARAEVTKEVSQAKHFTGKATHFVKEGGTFRKEDKTLGSASRESKDITGRQESRKQSA